MSADFSVKSSWEVHWIVKFQMDVVWARAQRRSSRLKIKEKKSSLKIPYAFFKMSGQILANSGTCSQWRAKSFLKLHQKFHTAAISRDIFENFLIGYETELTQKHLVKVGGVSAQILMKPSQLFWWRTIASLKCYRIVFVLIPSKKVPKLSIIRIHKLSGSIFLEVMIW